jgi:hypothetical protein
MVQAVNHSNCGRNPRTGWECFPWAETEVTRGDASAMLGDPAETVYYLPTFRGQSLTIISDTRSAPVGQISTYKRLKK